MSNSLAIAAASRTLRNVLLTRMPELDPELADLEVTLQPPEDARKNVTKAQLNVFLFQVVTNAAWRNMDMPGQVRPGETAPPALALNLHYLFTAWGRGDVDNDAIAHRVLAAAMSCLHDRPLLDPSDISGALSGNDLASQVERVRLSPLPQSVEELSKLWTAIGSGYRLSVAYEAAVVLIDSNAARRSPLPVLKRGAQDQGVFAVASGTPILDAITYPRGQGAARLGDSIDLAGRNLAGSLLRIDGGPLVVPFTVTGTTADDGLALKIPALSDDPTAMDTWAPGIFAVAALSHPSGLPATASNVLPLAIAPTIAITPLTAAPGDIALSITCSPRVRDGQRVTLLFGEQPVPLGTISNPSDASKPTVLTFTVPGVAAGTYTVRLRVDGVDSVPVDFTGATPAFAVNQQVVVS